MTELLTLARGVEPPAPRETTSPEPGYGLYLHVPFCGTRCHYCDFNTYAGLESLMPRYVRALRVDLAAVAAGGPRTVAPPGTQVEDAWPVFTSVFVGGGTPTLLPAGELAGILRLAHELLPIAAGAEVTVEANPETVTVEGMAKLVEAGVNRVSMGAQSFAPHVLEFLGRRHDPERPQRAVADARAAGVRRISLDLIYGTPGETDADWRACLAAALDVGTGHLSAYALTLEPNTEYGAQVRAGVKPPPDDDVAAERMAVADATLAAAGFARYEISNWARVGDHCRHNLTYWRGGNYLGVGAGAHGHWDGRRWWSLRAPARYAERALAGDSTTAGDELLDDATRREELLFLGLRLSEGVRRTAVEPVDESAAEALVRAGLLADDGDRLRLTAAGRPLANAVTVRLLG